MAVSDTSRQPSPARSTSAADYHSKVTINDLDNHTRVRAHATVERGSGA
jgi:hypothetical protein